MRYGLYLADLRRTATDSQGTINYAVGLCASLAGVMARDEQLFALANPEVAAELHSLSAHAIDIDIVPAPAHIGSRLLLDHHEVRRWAQRRRLDVLHFPKGHVPLRPIQGTATVATAHDDIALRYASGALGHRSGPLKSGYFAWAARHGLRSADQILTVSEFSAARLAEHARPARPIIVTYEGVDRPRLPMVTRSARRPHIVIMGSVLPHKNTLQSVTWASRFLSETDGGDARLVVTGRLDPATEALCAPPAITRVRAFLPAPELAGLVGTARALVFGSTYEGFGLPPVEAYAMGTPATFNNVGAMAEILDGFPGGHGPDYGSFAAALRSVLGLTDGDLDGFRAKILERYDWALVARRTLLAMRAIANPLPS
ncbi:MAG: glycosyltransferase [Acidimicrobiales bacterium]